MASLQLAGAFVATTVMLSGCGGGDTTTKPPVTSVTTPAPVATKNIAELATATKDLSTLVTALAACELVDTFTGTTEYTVFAPVNEAFTALGDVVTCLLEPVGLPTLTEVLEYHVVAGNVQASDLTDGETVATLDGKQELKVKVADGVVTLNTDTTVTTPNIEATNGVVHEVNKVLIPPNFVPPNCGTEGDIASLAVATSSLSTLVAALTAADLVDVFKGKTVYTVFAPTNDAFDALGEGCVAILTKAANKAALTEILKYHVVEGYDVYADITDGLQVATIDNKLKLTFTVADGVVTIDGSSKVALPDNYATNGVVHVIDAVLVPEGWTNPCAVEMNSVVV